MASTEHTPADGEQPQAQAPPPKEILYCPHCTFPPEYCSFGSSASKCRAWLVSEHPDLAEVIYGSGSGGDAAAEPEAGAGSKKKAAKKGGDDGEGDVDVDGTANRVEGLTLKQQEDEAKEREKKERREDKKREKEAKERKVSQA